MIRLFLCIISLLYNLSAFAQIVKLTDSKTNKAIENVYIFDSKNSISTNSMGEARLAGFSKNKPIYFQHPSYKNLQFTFSELENKSFIVSLQSNIFRISEVMISANKWEENSNEIPIKLIKITKDHINQSTAQTSADLLKESNQVYIQKSQLGGGSPMIRGFAANRVLIVLDGIRLNNAIYRSGNLQNIINIDPNCLESAEVILGPGSIIYGSDAIGGVMDFHTIKPRLSTSEVPNINFSFKSRYSSANNEAMNHAKYSFGTSKWSLAGSVSYSDFSDLKMGKHGPDYYLRPQYVISRNGIDAIIQNPNPENQKHSGYSQINVLQKIRFKASETMDLQYNFQHSETSNIPRYDRLIQYSGGQLKYAEWFYGPQKLQLHSLKINNSKPTFLYNSYKVIAGYQNYQESRHSRKFGSSTLTNRDENLKIYSVNADAEKQINSSSLLFYGSEWTHNKINSYGNDTDIFSNEKLETASRYPDNSKYTSLALYSNLKWKLNSKWTLNTGIRYSHFWITSNLNNRFYNFPFDNLNLSLGAVNAGIGISYLSNKGWLLKLNATSGFRAPNIDDVAKVFDSEPGKVVVPNKNLKPETVYNFEINLSKNFSNILFLDLNGFYSFLDQAMLRKDFSFNGQTTLIYDGEESSVQAIVNTDNAKIWGGNFSAILKITDRFSANTSFTFTKGKYKDGSPVRHVPPLFGNTSVTYKAKHLTSKLSLEFNDEISYKDLAGTERDKAYLYAKDKNGNPYSPFWMILSFNNQIQISKKLHINISVENILDKRYRPYSSGISASGRNFILGVCYTI
ncbi:TonB-dependent receptor domain-containing protein [Labilibaculum sp.]|uniref:TonB-dependent receptor plug domain-containing protein n=1 Tax=Labilibaculum sp. TaxID=2060723 RepID=UPI002AA88B7A|nr:TonB-dependent receptor [Labilibaculum sp.]